MSIQMKDVLQAAGPSASLVFASWIFLSFLQQRYVAAFQTFRALVDARRKGSENAVRLDALESQVRQYRRRCDWMPWATNIGVVSALCFLATLWCGLVAVALPELTSIGTAGAVLCSAGFVLVMLSAAFTIVENSLSAAALDDEVRDMESLDRR